MVDGKYFTLVYLPRFQGTRIRDGVRGGDNRN
jgi:hypothetical protein